MVDLGDFIEVELPEPDNFLKVKETLTRIGVASLKTKTLYQSCLILHKRGKFYIVHFKEMFLLDGKPSDFTIDDKARRNTIANLLHEWNLVKLVDPAKSAEPLAPLNSIKVLSYAEKPNWVLQSKYTIGRIKKDY